MLPKPLQAYGVRSIASAKLCVDVRATYKNLVRFTKQTWSAADETTGVDVIGHGPLGNSIRWDDSLRIVKETSDQSLLFEVYINNLRLAQARVVLSELLHKNDGSTKETSHYLRKLDQSFLGASAPARLIVAARVGTSTPFRASGRSKAALTVLTCPMNKLVRP